jgi:hypothetical protein
MARRAAVAVALALGTACGSLLGFEDGYTVSPDAGSGGGPGQAGEGGAGGSDSGGAGGEGGIEACAHPLCEPSIGALDAACDPCVAQVCETTPYCCDNSWDPECVARAVMVCDLDCCGDLRCLAETCTSCPGDCGDCACGHTVCTAGTPLAAADCFAPCGMEICAMRSDCCTDYGWTIECTELAVQICGAATCITDVCADNPSCCDSAGGWTASCVATVTQQCETACDCIHDPCVPGQALVATCDPCVAAACEVDPFCCNASGGYWDPLCASYVLTVCGSKCGS